MCFVGRGGGIRQSVTVDSIDFQSESENWMLPSGLPGFPDLLLLFAFDFSSDYN